MALYFDVTTHGPHMLQPELSLQSSQLFMAYFVTIFSAVEHVEMIIIFLSFFFFCQKDDILMKTKGIQPRATKTNYKTENRKGK